MNTCFLVGLINGRKGESRFRCDACSSTWFVPSNTFWRINDFPTPMAPHMNTFLPSLMNLRMRSICFPCIVVTTGLFFCSIILMKDSIDDLTNQAIDLVLQNDALHKRVMEPLKRKMFPFIASAVLTNLAMFILLVYLARRLSLLPLPLPLPHTLPLPLPPPA